MRLARLFNHCRSCVTAGLATEGSAPAGQNHPPPAGLRTGGAEPPAACGCAHRRGRTTRRLRVCAPAGQNHPPPGVCAPAGQNHPPPAGVRTGGAETTRRLRVCAPAGLSPPPVAYGRAHGRDRARIQNRCLIKPWQLVPFKLGFFLQRSSQALIQGLAACPFGLAGTE